jgi:hypothetical protein
MKRYATGLLLFSVLVIVAAGNVVFQDASPIVKAVEEVSVGEETDSLLQMENPEASTAVVIVKKSDYILPYPGILQNHPLYVLKEFRDKIIETLIVDPLRKSEFYLLQSDKWIAASELLTSQGQQEVGQKVFDASADRLSLAVDQLQSIKDGGREIPSGTIDNIENSVEKHLEITDEFSVEKKINPDQARQTYMNLQEKIQSLRN